MKTRPFILDVIDEVRQRPWEAVVNLSLLAVALASIYAAIWIIGSCNY